jgi:hypothetical protein
MMAKAPVKTLTFAAVDSEGRRRSHVWRFIIRGSDIYFAPGLHFGPPQQTNYHISLHRDGKCHRTFDEQFFDAVGADRVPNRRTAEWRRPPTPQGAPGVAVYTINVLPDDKAAKAPDRLAETFDMVLPAPTAGFTAELVVVYSLRPPGQFNTVDGAILCHHTLANGETVYFVGRTAAYDPRLLPMPPSPPGGNAVWLGPQDKPVVLPNDFRGVLFVDPQDDLLVPAAFDVSVTVSPDNPRHLDYVLVTPPASTRAHRKPWLLFLLAALIGAAALFRLRPGSRMPRRSG